MRLDTVAAFRMVIRTAARLCAALPAPVAAGLATVGGTVEWALRPGKRRVLAANLGHTVGLPADAPDVHRLVRRNMQAGARRAAGMLWALDRPSTAARRVRIEPAGRLREVLAEGRGVVLTSAHVGPFESVAAVAHVLPDGVAMAVVAEDTRTGRAMAPLRRRMGVRVVDTATGFRPAVDLLRAGNIVVVIADLHRDGMRGHRVPFLDGTLIVPGGPAALARLAGAPLMTFTARPVGWRRWRVDLDPPIPAPRPADGRAWERTATAAVADAFAAAIRAQPEQWDAVDPLPWGPAP